MKRFLQGWTLSVLVAAVLAACGETPITGTCDPTDPACNPTDTTDTTTTPPPALTVVSVTPADGATEIETGATVSIVFNRAVAASSVTTSSVTVGSAPGDRSVSGSTVTFTPTSDLDEGTSYTVTVNGVTDGDGVGLASAFTSSFTTVSFPVAADAGADFDVSFGDEVTLEPQGSTGTGATATWTQISGASLGALSGEAPTFTAPESVGDYAFELSVTDGSTTEVDSVRVWVLEDADHAIWVAPSGSSVAAGGLGTRAAPLASIQEGITESDNAGFLGDVYVAAGSYNETLTLAGNVSLYGGFDETDWSRDISTNKPVVSGDAVAVVGVEAGNLTVEGFEIIAADAVGTAASSIAILLNNASGVLLTGNSIMSGAGTAGTGGAAHTARARTGSNGSNGRNATECVSSHSGGARGENYRRGGNGGSAGWGNGSGGGSASSTASGGGGGGSGATGGGDNGGRGGDAWRNGSAGANGVAGSAFGSVTGDGVYVPESTGTRGSSGGAGFGGGGGGGGHGITGACGGSGGGGGGGGEGGAAGHRGTGGGASFGVLLVGLSVAEITDNEITTGVGGIGGSGSNGQSGGYGGVGRRGGYRACDSIITSWCTGAGGRGGDGSTGGRGGHGGGGGGGPSIGIVEGADASATQSGNVFTLGGGGTGGVSAGNDGPTGESVEHKKIIS